MDPARKRTVRLVVALSAAVLLAVALIYTSVSASSEARSPSQLMSTAQAGKTYQLTGKVMPGYERNGTVTNFRVRDRTGTVSVPVRYDGMRYRLAMRRSTRSSFALNGSLHSTVRCA